MSVNRTAVRRMFVLTLVVGAVACGVLALQAGDDEARAETAAPLATPLWSPRRVPQPIVDAVGAVKLQVALDEVSGGVSACALVTDGNGDTVLAAHSPETPLIAASTVKVLTGVAALATLGPDHVFETAVVAPGGVQDGTVNGLWLVGSGDPIMATPDYAAYLTLDPFTRADPTTSFPALAQAIVDAGVQRVAGGITGDDSRYDDERYIPTWSPSYAEEGHVGPIGALTVNDGFASFPPPEVVPDPAVHAATVLTELLRDRGVVVEEGPQRGGAPADAQAVASISSLPLRDIVSIMIRGSDNLTAEMLTREIGLQVSGEGTTAAGTQAIITKLAELGVPTEGVALVDGSGLDRADVVPCHALLGALDLDEHPELQAVWDGLPVAGGESGTLSERLEGTPLEGNLRAKTGSLNGVTGLTGVIDMGGRPVRFAFLANDSFDEAGGVSLRERAATIISRFPEAPPADALVPGPDG